jgi:hypothetical protein
LRQLSTNPANIVVGLVRNKSNTDKKVAEDGLKNVTILEADGSLDYLINNAAFVSEVSGFNTLADL